MTKKPFPNQLSVYILDQHLHKCCYRHLCLSVRMNIFVSETLRAKAIKFVNNMSYYSIIMFV